MSAPAAALPPQLQTWRCAGCGRIVAKLDVEHGRVEILCKCKTLNVLQK